MKTVDDLRTMQQATITPAIASEFLGCNQQWLRLMARERPEQLGFPVCCMGNRVKIPRLAFIRFLTGE